ncbi:MAG: HD domain-containing protein [Candidatus Poribacteria bacterium]|nr:HD domain-containing protein [Candidatus Poribacteria bacterium]
MRRLRKSSVSRGNRRQRAASKSVERRYGKAASLIRINNPTVGKKRKWALIVAGASFLLTWICMPIYESGEDVAATEEEREIARKNTIPIFNLELKPHSAAKDLFEQISDPIRNSGSGDEAQRKAEILDNTAINSYFRDPTLVDRLIQHKDSFSYIQDETLDVFESVLLGGVRIAGDYEGTLLGILHEYYDPDRARRWSSVAEMEIEIVPSDTEKGEIVKVEDIPDIHEATESAHQQIDELNEPLNPEVKQLMKDILGGLFTNSFNLSFDKAATTAQQEKNAAEVKPIYKTSAVKVSSVFLGTFLLVASILGSAVFYCLEIQVGSGPTAREWAAYGLCVLVAIGALRVGSMILESPTLGVGTWVAFPALLLPVGTAAGLSTILIGPAYGILTTLALSILAGVMSSISHDASLPQLLTLLASGFVSTFAMLNIRRRKDLVTVSVYTTGAAVLIALAASALHSDIASLETLRVGGSALVAGFLSAAFIPLALPGLEFIAGSATDLELMDLSDLDHPLLERVQKTASGTFNHSLNVARLAEAAAITLDENVLLARVGAYFHDIGKINSPATANYFIENQKGGPNPHDQLKPTMSARILIAHVKDGVALGRDNRLPKAALDLIMQHHGTSLIRSFYHKARQAGEAVDESSFRYPGPKPQTKLAAIMMLADSIEAAANAKFQTTRELTRRDCENVVQEIVSYYAQDGQLDESELTLNDLRLLSEQFERTLLGMYHSRIQYPEDSKTGPDPTELSSEVEPSTALDNTTH